MEKARYKFLIIIIITNSRIALLIVGKIVLNYLKTEKTDDVVVVMLLVVKVSIYSVQESWLYTHK